MNVNEPSVEEALEILSPVQIADKSSDDDSEDAMAVDLPNDEDKGAIVVNSPNDEDTTVVWISWLGSRTQFFSKRQALDYIFVSKSAYR